MKQLGIFYNEGLDALLIFIKKSGNITKTEKITNGVFSIYSNDGELVGINILDFKSNYNLDIYKGLNSDNQFLITFLKREFLKWNIDIGDFNLTPQYKVGRITKIEKVVDSDHLNICEVDLGTESQSVICGATNVKKGLKVVVALTGAVLPSLLEIRESIIRGHKSSIMICSNKELGINDSELGIKVLNDKYNVGKGFWEQHYEKTN